MASNSEEYGYEDERFQNVVNPNFHCSICLNVLKAPKMCRNNQHVFCSSCITRHLANSPTCPECMQELTIQTLNQAPRVLLNCLSELNINCDYYSRGCREYSQIGNLNTHVLNCGFGPVRCANYGCVVEINKRDKIYHETEVCEFRKVKCHDCGEIRKDVDELKQNQTEIKENLAELKANHTELKKNQAEMKENLAELKANQAELKEQLAQLPCIKEDIVKEVRAMMGEVLKHVNAVQAVQPPLHIKSASKQDIVVMGGEGDAFDLCSSYSSSVETFSWEKGAWARLPSMKERHSSASSFVYEDHVIVVGGFNGLDHTCGMEMLKTDQEPLQWITFPATLPLVCISSGHITTVVYENRLIVIGKPNWTEDNHSNAIYEIHLIPPYSTKLLRRMPQPRVDHGTELVNDKIFILGGKIFCQNRDVTVDSVIVYDVVKNECKEMRPLPYAVWGMATVSWRNKIILVGGENANGQVLNDVIMYDIESGESESLPSMKKYKRLGCSAVVTGDVMVVMGGRDEDWKYLDSVECFSFSNNSWKELPAMMEGRLCATAVVKPIK